MTRATERLLRCRPTFSKSLVVSVAVSKLGCTELLFVEPAVKVNGWWQILPRSYAEEANAVSHASHCWQHVCVPARQCTCAPRSWNSPAAHSAGNTGRYLSRFVAAKQPGPKPGWLSNLWTDAKACVQEDTAPRHHAATWSRASLAQWASISQNVIDEAFGEAVTYTCVNVKGHHFEHLLY